MYIFYFLTVLWTLYYVVVILKCADISVVTCTDIWWACAWGFHPLSPDMPWDSMPHGWQDSLPPSTLKTCMTRSHLEQAEGAFRPWCEGQTGNINGCQEHGWITRSPIRRPMFILLYYNLMGISAKQNEEKQDLLILIVSNGTGDHKVSCPCFVYQEKG